MKFQLYLHRFLLIQTLPGAMDHLPPASTWWTCLPVGKVVGVVVVV